MQVLPYRTAEEEDPVVNLLEVSTNYYTRQRMQGHMGMSFALDWSVSAATNGLAKLTTQPQAIPLPPHLAAARAAGVGSGAKKNGLDLSDCLQAFAKEEVLRKSEAWYCSKCQEHMEASKKIDLWKLPDILIIHLKRFVYDSFRRDKIDAYVDFPLTNLDLGPFTNATAAASAGMSARGGGKAANTLYDLYAVSNHFGGLGGGHYTAYCRNLVNQRWYDLDDSSATPLHSAEQVKTPAAYVLFYRRQKAKFQNQ
jgi:uncharacterized UBP type Zn finger protein